MKLSHEEFKHELLDRILEIRPLRREGNTRYAIRCPICGDSKRDHKKTRFYVKIDLNNDEEPVLYYCFNCNEYGIMTPSILKALDISDMSLLSGLQAYNKRVGKLNKNYRSYSERLNVILSMIDTENPSNILKKKYFEERLGIEVTFEDMLRFKAVFRLGDFLIENGIETVTVHPEKAKDIHENYLGFLTANNETINARQIFEKKSKGRRYEKYSLYKDRIGQLKFYALPKTVDVMTKETITINISEGVFDIFGVYYHIDRDKDITHSLYIAVCGSGYRSVIEYFIRQAFVCNVIVNIYADDDQSIEIYRKLKREFGAWFEEFNVYTNALYGDFGTTKERIKPIKNKV